jgi:hypothetical protein
MGSRGVIRSDYGGWVLLEVLAAVAVLAILVGPLAAGVIAILERGADTERQADSVGASDREDADVWVWGDRALEAVWSPGPGLRVQIAATADVSDAVVGFWADGWLVAQVSPTDTGQVAMDGPRWVDRAGQELVIRVRRADGPWGPPWRTLVPDVTGVAAAPAGGPEMGFGGEAVVHAPVAANPQFGLEGNSGYLVPGPSGSPFFATLVPAGPAGVRLDTTVGQSWLSEPGRGVDVYF